MPFMFAREELLSFANALEELLATRSGAAELYGMENEDVIRFGTDHEGELRASGTLHEAPEGQTLTFAFVAKWTGLPVFLQGLRQLQADLAT